MKFLCKVFGHVMHKGNFVFSIEIRPQGGTWHAFKTLAETTFCKRCGFVPITPSIDVGVEDAGIKYGKTFDIREGMSLWGPALSFDK